MAEFAWQFARFGVVGGALTVLMSLLYLLAINLAAAPPVAALIAATAIASIVGYFAHSKISFRSFGGRDRPAVRLARFLVTNGIGFLLNLAFVYLLIDLARLPEWVPTIPFCVVTPVVTFLLNRSWVFG